MIIAILKTLFTRDLNRLKNELELYKTEACIWKVEPHIANSAGNLCLHLIGNLNHFIGREFGGTGYVRNRELEFSDKNVPRSVLLQKIEETITVVNHALNQLPEAGLTNDYSAPPTPDKISNGAFLIHLTTHLTYHLGQINYHRRLLDA